MKNTMLLAKQRPLTKAAAARAARWRRAYDLVDFFKANIFIGRDAVACEAYRVLQHEARRAPRKKVRS